MTSSPTPWPDELTWTHCSCGYPSCKYSYPNDIGTFEVGTGFEPDERAELDLRWNGYTTLLATNAALVKALGAICANGGVATNEMLLEARALLASEKV